ncbi:MAG: hypothetical protein ACFE95_10625 [Candidatus Hodarchaeota archaeon]
MYEEESDDLRTIKALPLWQAFLAAILVPVVIAIVFGILGSRTNSILMQFELILVAIAFCLAGILTRSKLRGLLSIFAAPISWFLLFLIDILTAGWIKNPYGVLTGLTGPLTAIFESGIMGDAVSPDLIQTISQVAIILDLIIVEILAFFLGFLLAALATGFWKKNGELSIFSIVMKPFAAIFTILIIILIPFTYHGIANFADGGVSMGAGFSEFIGFFGGEFGGGAGAQLDGTELDLNDPEVVENLTIAAENAEKWFRRSSAAFGQVQGNFLVRAIINAIFPEGTDYGGVNMREITKVLDISDVFADVSGGLPYLLAGYQNMANGFKLTFGVLGESSIGGGSGATIEGVTADYDPNFNAGLANLTAAFQNFSDAEDYVVEALGTAEDIVVEVIVDPTAELGFVIDLVEEAKVGYGVIIEVANASIPLLNATYETTLAVDELGRSNFQEANTWMGEAANDVTLANSLLQPIDITQLNENSTLPFYGTVKIIQDMTQLLSYFSIAAANGTACYLAIEKSLAALHALDFSGGGVLATDWNDLSGNVSAANKIFSSASGNMSEASTFADSLTDESYGPIIDGSFKPMLEDFSNMIRQFSTNITEIGYQLTALEHTVFAIQSFTEGVNLFNQTWNHERAEAGFENGPGFLTGFTNNNSVKLANDTLQMAIINASLGHGNLTQATKIPKDSRTSWQNVLYWPTPPQDPIPTPSPPQPPSIAGLSRGAQNAIGLLFLLSDWYDQGDQNDLVQTFFDNMETIGLDKIFGGG